MKIAPECIPCLLGRLLYETNLSDPTKAEEVMRESCSILSKNLTSDICSADLATQVHGRTYEILNTMDPYEEVKELAMSVGLKLQQKAEDLINQNSDKLRTAILCSIVGNVLDFGIEGSLQTPDELPAKFDEIYHEGLGHDDTDKIKQYLIEDTKLLLFLDNCGEIVFDKLLCKELKKFNLTIIAVVKGVPILSDATLVEADQIALDEVVDAVITTGHYAVGMNVKDLSPELQSHLDNADLIICKGMANFEALSETDYRPVLYLLRTKCAPVAAALNLPKDLNVAKLIE